jgi:hypothetical protein
MTETCGIKGQWDERDMSEQHDNPRWRRWLRRIIAIALMIIAAWMCMDLHHVRPWAYILGDSRFENPSDNPSCLDEPQTLTVEDEYADAELDALMAKHGFRLRYAPSAAKIFENRLSHTEIKLDAYRVPL